jgi:hypothetical protein
VIDRQDKDKQGYNKLPEQTEKKLDEFCALHVFPSPNSAVRGKITHTAESHMRGAEQFLLTTKTNHHISTGSCSQRGHFLRL